MSSRTPVLANDNVTAVVHALLGLRRRRQSELAHYLEMDSGTMSRAMNGKRRWTVEDLRKMADFFEVEPAIFFLPAEDLLPSDLIRSRWFSHDEQDRAA